MNQTTRETTHIGATWNRALGTQPRTATPGEADAKAGKKFLLAPLFGPAQFQCYECGDAVDVPYFGKLTGCPDCGGNRFTLP